MFPVTRVYSDDNGDSHFEDVSIPLRPGGVIGFLSDPLGAKEVIFREVDPSYDWNFHTAPTRQLIILLDGEIEITTSQNVRRKFRGGDVLLMEDTTGKGHKTKNILPIKRKSIFITLPQ
jgi:hypothetical protein